MARNFNGTSDYVTLGVGSLGFTGAVTIATIARISGAVDFAPLFEGYDSVSTANYGFWGDGVGGLYFESFLGGLAGGAGDYGGVYTDGEFMFLAVTKAASALTVPRYHSYSYQGSTGVYWTHIDGSTLVPGVQIAPNTIALGTSPAYSYGYWYKGEILIIGVWNEVLTDVQIEQLPFSLKHWFGTGTAKTIVMLDQETVTQKIVDLTGNGSNEATVTGTTVNTQPAPGFNRHGALIQERKQTKSNRYSRGSLSALPATDADLEYQYSGLDYGYVASDDDVRVPVLNNTSRYAIHLFKQKGANNTAPIVISVQMQSATAPSSKTVLLQIYNRNSSTWETLASDSATAANTDFTLSGTQFASLTNYYDGSFEVAVRVYQLL